MRRLAVLLLLLPLCAGCGTMLDLDAAGPRLYGGVRHDWRQIAYPAPADRVLVPAYVLDLPLSLVADTLLFPISVGQRLAEPEPRRAKARPGAD